MTVSRICKAKYPANDGEGARLAGMGSPGSTPRVGTGPTVDGRVITVRFFYEAAPEISKNVPMPIGSGEEGNRMSSKLSESSMPGTTSRRVAS